MAMTIGHFIHCKMLVMKIETAGEINLCIKICSNLTDVKKNASMTSPVTRSIPVLMITLPSSICLLSFNTWHHIPTYSYHVGTKSRYAQVKNCLSSKVNLSGGNVFHCCGHVWH